MSDESKSVESKVPGFTPGEFVRDQLDERFLKVCPKGSGMDGATHLQVLQAAGLAVVITQEELRQGGYARALAKAITLGTPVLMPYEDYERRPHERFGQGDEVEQPFDYLAWKKEQLAKERAGNDLVSNPRILG